MLSYGEDVVQSSLLPIDARRFEPTTGHQRLQMTMEALVRSLYMVSPIRWPEVEA